MRDHWYCLCHPDWLLSIKVKASLTDSFSSSAASVASPAACIAQGGVAAQVLPDGSAIGLRVVDPRLTPTLARGTPKGHSLASGQTLTHRLTDVPVYADAQTHNFVCVCRRTDSQSWQSMQTHALIDMPVYAAQPGICWLMNNQGTESKDNLCE